MYMFKHFTRAIERLIRVKSRCFEKIDTFLLNGHIGPALQSAPPPRPLGYKFHVLDKWLYLEHNNAFSSPLHVWD